MLALAAGPALEGRAEFANAGLGSPHLRGSRKQARYIDKKERATTHWQ